MFQCGVLVYVSVWCFSMGFLYVCFSVCFTVGFLCVSVWGFSLLSVTIISLVGLLCVAIVPLTRKVYFNHVIQFLVSVAVGSLTGDALLHLLPHVSKHPL